MSYNKQTIFIYYVDQARLYGFTEDKDDVPDNAVEIKEVEVHPAQVDWVADVFRAYPIR